MTVLRASLLRSVDRPLDLATASAVAFASTGDDAGLAHRAGELRDGRPAPGARLRFTATAYCKGTTTASGVNVRNGIAAADPDLLPVGSVDPGRRLGGAVQRHLHRHGHRPEGPGPARRHLHVELQRGAGARPAADASITVLRLGWNPQASTPAPGRPALPAARGRASTPRRPVRRARPAEAIRSARPASTPPRRVRPPAFLILVLQLIQLVVDPALRQQLLVGARLAQLRPCAAPGSCPCPGSSTAGARSRCVVRPAISTCSASRISSSVSVSTLDVASSRTRIARIERQRARERQQLLLADRQRRAALGDRAARSRPAARSMKRSAWTAARRRPHLLVGDRRVPSRMFAAIVPENRCTSCSTRLNSRRSSCEVHLADVDAVDEDAPAGDVVEPQQQVDDRRLPRAGGADDADPLARA